MRWSPEAGRGIGRGIGLGLADCGADVAVVARRLNDVEAVAGEIEERGRRGLGLSADVMDFDSIPKVLDRVVDEFGGLDIMVNNAGGNLDRKMYSLPDISLEKFDEQLTLNMKTKWWGSQQAAKRMRKGGRIINIISIAAHRPLTGFRRLLRGQHGDDQHDPHAGRGTRTEGHHRQLHRPRRDRDRNAGGNHEGLGSGRASRLQPADPPRSHRHTGRLRRRGGVSSPRPRPSGPPGNSSTWRADSPTDRGQPGRESP